MKVQNNIVVFFDRENSTYIYINRVTKLAKTKNYYIVERNGLNEQEEDTYLIKNPLHRYLRFEHIRYDIITN